MGTLLQDMKAKCTSTNLILVLATFLVALQLFVLLSLSAGSLKSSLSSLLPGKPFFQSRDTSFSRNDPGGVDSFEGFFDKTGAQSGPVKKDSAAAGVKASQQLNRTPLQRTQNDEELAEKREPGALVKDDESEEEEDGDDSHDDSASADAEDTHGDAATTSAAAATTSAAAATTSAAAATDNDTNDTTDPESNPPEDSPGHHAPHALGPTRHSVASKDTKYLLPHLLYGPNNQYHGLREAIILARTLGRVLVLPRIVVHYKQFKKGLPRWYEFHDVFDVDTLSSYLETSPLASFKALTNSHVSMIWRPRVESLYTAFEKRFAEVQEVTIRKVIPLHDLHKANKKKEVFFTSLDDVRATLGAASQRYVAISCLYGTLVDFSGHLSRNHFLNETIEVSPYLRFSDFFRSTSKTLNPLGGKVIYLHVRTDEREAECLAAAAAGNKLVCFGLGRPYYHLDVSCLAAYLTTRAKELGLAGVYISPATREDSLIQDLRRALDFPVLTYEDLATQAAKLYEVAHPPKGGDTTAEPGFVPPFIVSTLEQQLAIDSAVFLGTRQSTWSQFVRYSRMGQAPEKAVNDQYLNTFGCAAKFSVKYFKKSARLKENV